VLALAEAEDGPSDAESYFPEALSSKGLEEDACRVCPSQQCEKQCDWNSNDKQVNQCHLLLDDSADGYRQQMCSMFHLTVPFI